jgi:hypothetical protein
LDLDANAVFILGLLTPQKKHPSTHNDKYTQQQIELGDFLSQVQTTAFCIRREGIKPQFRLVDCSAPSADDSGRCAIG